MIDKIVFSICRNFVFNNQHPTTMKHFLRISLTLIALIFTFTYASMAAGKDPLNFMVKCNLKLSKQFAKTERKPLLLYIHSTKCISSRTFTRQIVGKPEFAKWAQSNFICMEANVTTKKGKEIAKKYGVLKIPSIIMLSFDTDLEYAVEMKLDSESLYTQFRSFLTANSLKSQIELMRETNGLSYRQASVAIAKSYAASDYKKNPIGVAEMMASGRTLRIHKLNDLYEAYIS
ncbi:MAG: thioredoxin family protein, partial [Bacteroidota bacterium]|nr:thioredoxin family protein [Bacteroidota bacterium]